MPALLFLSLSGFLYIFAHAFLDKAIISFPADSKMFLWLIISAALFTACLISIIYSSIISISDSISWSSSVLIQLFVVSFRLGLLIIILRGAAFYMRVLPVIGVPLHALLSTLLSIYFFSWIGRQIFSYHIQFTHNLIPYVTTWIILFVFTGLICLILISRFPDSRIVSEIAPLPPLILPSEEQTLSEVTISSDQALMHSHRLRVSVNRSPFSMSVRDHQDTVIWQVSPQGFSLRKTLYSLISLPLLFTGNTIKTRWGIGQKPLIDAEKLIARGRELFILFQDYALRITFHSADILRIECIPAPKKNPQFNSLAIQFITSPKDHFLGLGQRFDRIDHHGQDIHFLVEEGGIGYGRLKPLLQYIFGARGSIPNGESCTSFPIPFLLIAREEKPSTGLYWATYEPSWLKLPQANTSDPAQLLVLSQKLDLFIFSGPTPLSVISQYTALTGRPRIPPDWAFLPWKTRTGPVTENDLLEDIQRFQELGIPLGQVGVEHWQEVRGSYEFSKKWYPNIDDVIRETHERGLRIGIWHFPYMNYGSSLYREGVKNGYFIKNRLGLPYHQRIYQGIAPVIDYTNLDASRWHRSIVSNRLHSRGFQSIMTDYGESIPTDAVFANGQTGISLRNAYPVFYSQAMDYAAGTVHFDDRIVYTRAGYATSQRFIEAQWPGDQDTDWDEGDGLPAAVRAMINISICGFPIHGSDIGGWHDWFTPPTSKELYLRWAEVGAYSPLMRTHGSPIYRNREPWKFDDETVEIFRSLSEAHVQLFPYLYSLSVNATVTGLPIIRHPALSWPEIRELYQVEDAWMLGDGLYVAPIIRRNQTIRRLLLPPGKWWGLNQSKAFIGPAWIEVESNLGQTPIFLRQGFPIPRFSRPFETFEKSISKVRKGNLKASLLVWLYAGETNIPFELFDGTLVKFPYHETLPKEYADKAGFQFRKDADADIPVQKVKWSVFTEK